ncbi:titin, partial [Selaginella moellendorffii]|uniref:titin n=1 Tax=Selaginella moellendorffii TaxID=88036 RepID=UPI000D1C2383
MGKCSSKERVGKAMVSKINAVQKSSGASSSNDNNNNNNKSNTKPQSIPSSSGSTRVQDNNSPKNVGVVVPPISIPAPPAPAVGSNIQRGGPGSVSDRFHDAQEELPDFPTLDAQGNVPPEEHPTPKMGSSYKQPSSSSPASSPQEVKKIHSYAYVVAQAPPSASKLSSSSSFPGKSSNLEVLSSSNSSAGSFGRSQSLETSSRASETTFSHTTTRTPSKTPETVVKPELVSTQTPSAKPDPYKSDSKYAKPASTTKLAPESKTKSVETMKPAPDTKGKPISIKGNKPPPPVQEKASPKAKSPPKAKASPTPVRVTEPAMQNRKEEKAAGVSRRGFVLEDWELVSKATETPDDKQKASRTANTETTKAGPDRKAVDSLGKPGGAIRPQAGSDVSSENRVGKQAAPPEIIKEQKAREIPAMEKRSSHSKAATAKKVKATPEVHVTATEPGSDNSMSSFSGPSDSSKVGEEKQHAQKREAAQVGAGTKRNSGQEEPVNIAKEVPGNATIKDVTRDFDKKTPQGAQNKREDDTPKQEAKIDQIGIGTSVTTLGEIQEKPQAIAALRKEEKAPVPQEAPISATVADATSKSNLDVPTDKAQHRAIAPYAIVKRENDDSCVEEKPADKFTMKLEDNVEKPAVSEHELKLPDNFYGAQTIAAAQNVQVATPAEMQVLLDIYPETVQRNEEQTASDVFLDPKAPVPLEYLAGLVEHVIRTTTEDHENVTPPQIKRSAHPNQGKDNRKERDEMVSEGLPVPKVVQETSKAVELQQATPSEAMPVVKKKAAREAIPEPPAAIPPTPENKEKESHDAAKLAVEHAEAEESDPKAIVKEGEKVADQEIKRSPLDSTHATDSVVKETAAPASDDFAQRVAQEKKVRELQISERELELPVPVVSQHAQQHVKEQIQAVLEDAKDAKEVEQAEPITALAAMPVADEVLPAKDKPEKAKVAVDDQVEHSDTQESAPELIVEEEKVAERAVPDSTQAMDPMVEDTLAAAASLDIPKQVAEEVINVEEQVSERGHQLLVPGEKVPQPTGKAVKEPHAVPKAVPEAAKEVELAEPPAAPAAMPAVENVFPAHNEIKEEESIETADVAVEDKEENADDKESVPDAIVKEGEKLAEPDIESPVPEYMHATEPVLETLLAAPSREDIHEQVPEEEIKVKEPQQVSKREIKEDVQQAADEAFQKTGEPEAVPEKADEAAKKMELAEPVGAPAATSAVDDVLPTQDEIKEEGGIEPAAVHDQVENGHAGESTPDAIVEEGEKLMEPGIESALLDSMHVADPVMEDTQAAAPASEHITRQVEDEEIKVEEPQQLSKRKLKLPVPIEELPHTTNETVQEPEAVAEVVPGPEAVPATAEEPDLEVETAEPLVAQVPTTTVDAVLPAHKEIEAEESIEPAEGAVDNQVENVEPRESASVAVLEEGEKFAVPEIESGAPDSMHATDPMVEDTQRASPSSEDIHEVVEEEQTKVDVPQQVSEREVELPIPREELPESAKEAVQEPQPVAEAVPGPEAVPEAAEELAQEVELAEPLVAQVPTTTVDAVLPAHEEIEAEESIEPAEGAVDD